MSGWILSIVGVVAVGVLVDILLDDKDLGKYIKGIFGIIVVLVILDPLPKMLKNNKKVDFNQKSSNIEMDKGAYSAIWENNIEYQEKELVAELRAAGQVVESVKIEYDKPKMQAVAVTVSYECGMIEKDKTQEIVKNKLGKSIEIKYVELNSN